jgi:TolB-like protein/DNA-binding winged helix-turn-helix (wHTH) protein/Flp pilus assembly protein TadD
VIHFLSIEALLSVLEDDHVRRRLRFGVFELDLRAGELRKHGIRIRLQEQPFQVLAMLLEHPGEVVTREELRKRLWPADIFVDFDHGLNKAINKVRDALGDSAENPRFVETVARRGYRFLSEVELAGVPSVRTSELESQLYPSVMDSNSKVLANKRAERQQFIPSLAWKMSALVLVVLIVSLATWKVYPWNRPPPVIRSLAVLPMENLSGDASQDYFSDGMTDELITELGQISDLRVISRTSAMTYKGTHSTLPQIAQELNVDAVVEGAVLRSGGRVRITAKLIMAATDKQLWAESYEGDLRDTLTLQAQVARSIADKIRINLNPLEQAALKVKVVDPEAYESYLKGRYFWNKRTADSLKVALAYFNQAIDKDPKYAEAYSGLADTYALMGDWQYALMTTKEALPKAKSAANKALALNDTLGEAHNSLAFCLDGFDWDFDLAGKEFRRAIELAPDYATAHHWYAWHLSLLGRNDEAIAEMRKAESLDPLSLIINSNLAELLLLARSYDESIQQSRKTIELDPNFGLAHDQLGQAYLQENMLDQAVAELQKAVQLSDGSPTCIANLARAYARSGKRSEAEKILSDLEHRSNRIHSYAPEIASIYVALGDNDQAMNWLGKGYEERFNPGVLVRPGFDPLRSDSRFQDLVHRTGLDR